MLVARSCRITKFWFAGEYLALTGDKISGAEMISCGLATHYSHSAVSSVLNLFCTLVPTAYLGYLIIVLETSYLPSPFISENSLNWGTTWNVDYWWSISDWKISWKLGRDCPSRTGEYTSQVPVILDKHVKWMSKNILFPVKCYRGGLIQITVLCYGLLSDLNHLF